MILNDAGIGFAWYKVECPSAGKGRLKVESKTAAPAENEEMNKQKSVIATALVFIGVHRCYILVFKSRRRGHRNFFCNSTQE